MIRMQFADGFFLGYERRSTWWAVERLGGTAACSTRILRMGTTIRARCTDSGLPLGTRRNAPASSASLWCAEPVRRPAAGQPRDHPDDLEQFDAAGFHAMLTGQLGERLASFVHTLNDDKGERGAGMAARISWLDRIMW